MRIRCPLCSAELSVPPDAQVKPTRKVLCPSCRQVFRLGEALAPAASPERVERKVPPVSDPSKLVKTRKMTSLDGDHAVETRPMSSGGLEEALGGISGANPAASTRSSDQWEVNRPDYVGSTFGLEELADLVKRGWLDRSDSVRPHGSPTWIGASELPSLAKSFAVRQKKDAMRISAAIPAELRCGNHPRARAEYRCDTCKRPFCASCGNETELHQLPVVLCLECDSPLIAIA